MLAILELGKVSKQTKMVCYCEECSRTIEDMARAYKAIERMNPNIHKKGKYYRDDTYWSA